MLRLEELTVRFGAFTALNRLNFQLDRRELRVVIGPNGAGKTTLLDVISGKVRPTQGKALFAPAGRRESDLACLREHQIACMGIGRKFQTPNVFKNLSALDNLRLALRGGRNIWSVLRGKLRHDCRARIQEILQTIGLAQKCTQLAGTLAHGEKQWLELGMLMAQQPELLLVDEPVAGMTPRESERTGELLLSLARKHTLLVIDHDMTFVRQIAQKVTVLHEGKLLHEGTMDEVESDPRVIEVYLGQDREAEEPAHAEIVPSTVLASQRQLAETLREDCTNEASAYVCG